MKFAQEMMLPVMLAAMFIALLLVESPAFARGNHGGHRGHGGHHSGSHARAHFSALPATSYAGYYCASLNRRVRDAGECPELNTQLAPEAQAPFTYRENRQER